VTKIVRRLSPTQTFELPGSNSTTQSASKSAHGSPSWIPSTPPSTLPIPRRRAAAPAQIEPAGGEIARIRARPGPNRRVSAQCGAGFLPPPRGRRAARWPLALPERLSALFRFGIRNGLLFSVFSSRTVFRIRGVSIFELFFSLAC